MSIASFSVLRSHASAVNWDRQRGWYGENLNQLARTRMTRMKLLLVAGTAFLGLAASEPAAHAQRVNFIYTGKLDTFKVPETGTYQIVAFGAQGGNGTFAGFVGVGGRGAEIGGNF